MDRLGRMVPRTTLAVSLTVVGNLQAKLELPILDRRGAGSRTPSGDDSHNSQCKNPNEKKPERRLKAASGRMDFTSLGYALYFIHAQILDHIQVKQLHQA